MLKCFSIVNLKNEYADWNDWIFIFCIVNLKNEYPIIPICLQAGNQSIIVHSTSSYSTLYVLNI